jgi:hypothetical protein
MKVPRECDFPGDRERNTTFERDKRSMFNRSKGKHARKRTRWVGPLFAFDGVMQLLAARSEAIDAIAAAELAQMAQS